MSNFDEVEAPSRRRKAIVFFVVFTAVVLVVFGLLAWWFKPPFLAQWLGDSTPASQEATTSAAASDTPTPDATLTTPTPTATPSATPSEADSPAALTANELVEQVRAYNQGDTTTPPTEVSEATATSEPPSVILPGEEWFGEVGVNVCSASTVQLCGDEEPVGGIESNWWQSVELAQRHYDAMRWYEGRFTGVEQAVDIYTQAESLGMTRQPFDDVTEIANGDMIVHGMANDEATGERRSRVAIVNFYDGNIIHAVEQNGNANARAVYLVVDKTLVRVDERDSDLVSPVNTAVGVVHSPSNKNNPLHTLRDGSDDDEFQNYLEAVKEAAAL